MLDAILLAAACACFLVAIAYARACEKP